MSGQKTRSPWRRLEKIIKGEREGNNISEAKGDVPFKREVYIMPTAIEKRNKMGLQKSSLDLAVSSSESFVEV